jgi:hypothetical protein
MPLFNNGAIVASFKATSTLTLQMETMPRKLNKCKLVKQDVPTGMTVLRLVLPTTEDSYYMDMPDATTTQALEAIMEILEQQEEI